MRGGILIFKRGICCIYNCGFSKDIIGFFKYFVIVFYFFYDLN